MTIPTPSAWRYTHHIPCKHFRSGLTNKTAGDCPYCRIDELESQMRGLSNEINDFQNIIERQKREIHELQCQQDTPLAFYDISHDEDGEVEYEFSVYPRPGFKPLYTQAVAKGEQT